MITLVQGQGAEVGQQVAGGAVQVPAAHVRCHGHVILYEKYCDPVQEVYVLYKSRLYCVAVVQVHGAQIALDVYSCSALLGF